MDTMVRVRFRDGDRSAFETVYRSLSGAVATVARSMLWSEDLIADAVQQTFVKAWRSRAGYDPERPVAPWMYAIARRVTIDIVRRERRREGTPLMETDLAVDGVSFEQVWTRFEIRAAIDALPDDERDVIRLQHLEGWTHAQIADRLDIPIGTVKSRSHRAHVRLSQTLGFLVDEPETPPHRMGDER